jgi:two-component system chemotaxis response regulator CheY
MADAGRVLIVDDARLIRSFYRKALETRGYAVDEALNGLEALEKLLLSSFDLLIVDINMPKMDGLTFLKMLRSSDGEVAGIPAMVTSTEARVVDRDAARAAGANYYLVKPVRAETLVLHVDLLTGRRS